MDLPLILYSCGFIVGLVCAGASRNIGEVDAPVTGALIFAALWPLFLPIALGLWIRSRIGE